MIPGTTVRPRKSMTLVRGPRGDLASLPTSKKRPSLIATLGTALTQEHARILKNYAQTVVLVFDSDDAGRRAADRALEVFVRGSLDIKLTKKAPPA